MKTEKIDQNENVSMERRGFVKKLAVGSVGALALTSSVSCEREKAVDSSSEANSLKKQVLMKIGCQYGETSKENLEFKSRHGIYHVDGNMPKFIEGKGWDLEDSLAKREACEKYGIKLEAYHLPLTSGGIDRVIVPNIMLGKSPERDREIEMIQQMIEVAGKTGVHLLNYNTVILPILRTGRTVDYQRGNVSYSTWNYEEALAKGESMTIAGEVGLDEIYERITYLLDRLLPVAEEYNVRLGNHIADPPVPAGFRGITRWNSPDVFEGIKRFAELYDSPSHGFNFCIGSTAEGLKDPATEIYPIIDWIGKRKQIFNVHLRNIKGGMNNFQEVFPDNGDLNFLEILRALREVNYDGMVMPDHVPYHEDPNSTLQGFAFSYGYLKGLLHTVASDA